MSTPPPVTVGVAQSIVESRVLTEPDPLTKVWAMIASLVAVVLPVLLPAKA